MTFKHLCGFKTKNMLLTWFTAYEIKKLKELGFVIKRIKANEVFHGKKQSIFKKAK